MCNAEDDLRRVEREVSEWHDRFEAVVEMAADVERGLIDLAEFRRKAERVRDHLPAEPTYRPWVPA